VPVRGTRINASYMGLAARVAAILLGVLILLAQSYADYKQMAGDHPDLTYQLNGGQILLPALLLLVIAALASIPLPSPVPPSVQPLAESLVAAIVIGALGGTEAFAPYLLVPIITCGLTAGAAATLGCVATAWGVLLGTAAVDPAGPNTSQLVMLAATWVPLSTFAGLTAAWASRVRAERAPEGEPAYADAHRLLSELHVVARQLSLGLDPQTLAAALLDDVATIVRHTQPTVLVRSDSGRSVPLVGSEPPAAAASAMQDAWTASAPIRRHTAGVYVTAIPVRMGERVVALVVMTGSRMIDDDTLNGCRAVIDQAGPRMASAMLFDDVRRFATVDERKRLAREIHDGIAQDLASVGYLLDDIRRDVDEGVGARVLEVRDRLRRMVADLRLSIFDLRTGVDDMTGLGTALGEYVQRVGSQAGLVVHVSMEESTDRLPIAVEVELLRMVQEAVTNVRKHAAARNLWLTLAIEPPSARITLADDGRGLQRPRPDSMGLTGMRERARRIGADLRIGPRDDGGTLVDISLPAANGHPPLSASPGGSRPIATATAAHDSPGQLDRDRAGGNP
jgi:signal transduction histidine kinase